jgi:hypothetical protein
MYVFFFPWARLGFTAFRIANAMVGSTVPCLIFLLSVKFRTNPYLAAVFALIACIHGQLIDYSIIGFPDMLATAMLLCGYLAYFSDRVLLATILLCLTVLTKEAFGMFLLPLVVDGGFRYQAHRSRLAIAPIAGLLVVVATSLISVRLLHGRPQGWSTNGIYEGFFSGFLFSYWYIPFGIVLLLHKEFQVLAVAVAAPLFFLIWGYALKKGVDQWYTIGPLAVALFVTSVSVQRAIEELQSITKVSGAELTSRFLNLRNLVAGLVSAMVLATLIMPPSDSGLKNIANIKTLSQMFTFAPESQAVTTQAVTKRLRKLKPESLLVMDTFWGYSFYPFGFLTSRVGKAFSKNTDNANEDIQLVEVLNRYDTIVWGENRTSQAKRIRNLLAHCVKYQDSQFSLYRQSRKCLANITK